MAKKKKKTYAKLAESIMKKYSKRPNDKMDRDQMNIDLTKLKNRQELHKKKLGLTDKARPMLWMGGDTYGDDLPEGDDTPAGDVLPSKEDTINNYKDYDKAIAAPGAIRGKPADYDTNASAYSVTNYPQGDIYYKAGSEATWNWDVAPDADTNYAKAYANAKAQGLSQFDWNGKPYAVKDFQAGKSSQTNYTTNTFRMQPRGVELDVAQPGLAPIPNYPNDSVVQDQTQEGGMNFNSELLKYVSPLARGLGAAWLSNQKLNYPRTGPELEEYRRTDVNPLLAESRASYATADRGAANLTDGGSRTLAKLAVGSARGRDVGSRLGGAEIGDSDRRQQVEMRNVNTRNRFNQLNQQVDIDEINKNFGIKEDALGLGIDAATDFSNKIQADALADRQNKNAYNMALLGGTENYDFVDTNNNYKDPTFAKRYKDEQGNEIVEDVGGNRYKKQGNKWLRVTQKPK